MPFSSLFEVASNPWHSWFVDISFQSLPLSLHSIFPWVSVSDLPCCYMVPVIGLGPTLIQYNLILT